MSTDREQLEALLNEAPVPTRRPTVAGIEDALFKVHSVLDHGFVRVVDYMGDDAAIVQAARVSYGAGTRTVSSDRGLIRYLMRHRHTTPFEMCELKLHVKLPMFVARQWIRHRTANVNEISARYSLLDREFYIPSEDSLAVQSASNKQGRGDTLDAATAAKVLDILKADAARCYENYEAMHDEHGLARELARMNLPVNIYTQWYWKVDLHNLLHFLSLRMHPHAQYEIRVFADVIGELVKKWVPFAYEAFEDYRLGGAFFSKAEVDVLRRALAGEPVAPLLDQAKLSGRERREFEKKLGL